MILLIFVLMGLCFGSFTNALVWRLHEQAELGSGGRDRGRSKAAVKGRLSSKLSPQPSALSPNDLSILKGRSMCPHCHHQLAVADLMPVLSWLSLSGKCRYCHHAIGLQYPVVEILTAFLFVFSYVYWPDKLTSFEPKLLFVFWLAFLVGLMALLVYDLKWMLLPNRLVYPLTGLVILQILVETIYHQGGLVVIGGAVTGFLVIGGLFYAIFQLSGGKWIGGGDVKLGFLLGLLVGGPAMALLVIFLASLLGSLVSVPLMLAKRLQQSSRIPFGPFLITSTIIVHLFGASLIAWYKRKLLYP